MATSLLNQLMSKVKMATNMALEYSIESADK